MPKINKIYVWSNLVRPKWTPWANTKFYLPLQWDILDHSWNNIAVTTDTLWSYRTFNTYGAVYSINWTVNWARTEYWNNTWYTSWTVSCLVKLSEYHWNGHFFTSWLLWLAQIPWTSNKFRAEFYGSSTKSIWSTTQASLNTWYHIVAVRDSGNLYLYINWTLEATWSGMSWTSTKKLVVPWWESTSVDWCLRWWLAEVIQEDKARTQADVTAYLNLVKNKYWIS